MVTSLPLAVGAAAIAVGGLAVWRSGWRPGYGPAAVAGLLAEATPGWKLDPTKAAVEDFERTRAVPGLRLQRFNAPYRLDAGGGTTVAGVVVDAHGLTRDWEAFRGHVVSFPLSRPLDGHAGALPIAAEATFGTLAAGRYGARAAFGDDPAFAAAFAPYEGQPGLARAAFGPEARAWLLDQAARGTASAWLDGGTAWLALPGPLLTRPDQAEDLRALVARVAEAKRLLGGR